MRRTYALTALLSLLVGLVVGLPLDWPAKEGEGLPEISIARIGDVDLTGEDDRVKQGEDFNVIPMTEYVGSDRHVDTYEERAAINRALYEVQNLKAWKLCSAELLAAAAYSRASGETMQRTARYNPPFTPADDPELIAHNMSFGASLMDRAARLEDAAKLADQAGVACTDPSSPPDKAHFAVIDTVGEVEQPDARLRVPDYAVMDGLSPLEYHILEGTCAEKVQDWLDEAKAKPVARKPDEGQWAGLSTWTERKKQTAIARHSATLTLLTEQKLSCSASS